MSAEVVKRGARGAGPELPSGSVELAEPPVLGEPAAADVSTLFTLLPMGLGGGAMALTYSIGGGTSTSNLMFAMMGVSMMGMGAGQLGRAGAQRRRQMRAERRDYLRYLAQQRTRVRQAAAEQRAAEHWVHPDPRGLWALVDGPRLWERRSAHDDFAAVRVGVGSRRAALELVPPRTRPVEDLEPLAAISLRRFLNAYRTVGHLPQPVPLRRFAVVEFAGDGGPALGLARAMVAQLAVLHSPDELRIAVLAGDDGRREWEWVKWLPHNAHPGARRAAGPVPLVADDAEELLDLLGGDVSGRPDHDPEDAGATPFVVIVAQHARIAAASRLREPGIQGVVVLDLTGEMAGGQATLRLTLTATGGVEYPSRDTTVVADADALSRAEAEVLARGLSAKRAGSAVDLDRPLESDIELTTLLGVRDARRFEPHALWRARTPQHARLRVPIGVSGEGEVVELDLKESAQGGMGPHGLLIGATGSGKSELLRTLVIGLAATHSSEVLNFVLVDFKGGATFRNMERLPHTSAVITNLADELHLVDRMRDSINGEMVRRQELLRASGHASLVEYEKARLSGAALAPLPALLLVVDEFSELLASQPDFIELFVSVGRLGRSLGVHLLLAAQRLEEGRINKVEGHLSYRIALRTFSALELRSLIGKGVPELPPAPGNGYLRIDTSTTVRFKAAYVSGPVPAVPEVIEAAPVAGEVVPFGLNVPAAGQGRDHAVELAPVAPTEPAPQPSSPDEPGSLVELLIERLRAAGPPARQVWVPPLDEPFSLDQLLPGIVPDRQRGLGVASALGPLRVPLGLVDRPYQQARELLVADLSGADGHVGVVGAAQTGKSTLLRTLILALALTRTPRQVQFYCLDFGGPGLLSLKDLPHVGSVATRRDEDRVRRTVEELFAVLEAREQRFADLGLESMADYRARQDAGAYTDDPYGDVFLVVDGWFTLRQHFEDLEPRIAELAARGISYGIHLVISATRWTEIRSQLRDRFGTRLELRLGDPMESVAGNRAARGVPNRPGRGLTLDAAHFLGALPRLDSSGSTAELTDATRAAVAEIDAFWTQTRAPAVRLLPTRLPAAGLPAPTGELTVVLGLDERRLAPVRHDFTSSPNLLVFGDRETGKTNLLRLVLTTLTGRFPPDRVKVALADARRGLVASVPEAYRVGFAVEPDALTALIADTVTAMKRRLPGSDIRPERLARRDWWTGPDLFLVVDDLDLFSTGGFGAASPLAPLAPLLAHGHAIGLHLIVARSTSSAGRALADPAVRRMWDLGAPGVLFSYPKEEGKFLGEAKPRTLPPGRAQLVTRRSVGLIHTALAD